jgi:membrane associated rhomboid family serine protease
MELTGAIGFIIIAITVLFSIRGFGNHAMFARYAFEVERIQVHREYYRFFTSALLHVNWMHLLFNMFALYAFSTGLEFSLGWLNFLIIYVASLLGGNLFALFIHRHHADYTAVGASGAVSGVIFACLALYPGMSVNLFMILPMPGWLFTILFVLISLYGIRSRSDNIGHEAHLGGALIGMTTLIIMRPEVVLTNYIPILLIAVPSIVFIVFILRRPEALYVDNLFYKTHQHYTIDDRYNMSQRNKQEEVDRILEKIHKKGMQSLTRREKQTLKEYSKSK